MAGLNLISNIGFELLDKEQGSSETYSCIGNRLRSQRTPTPYKIKVNNCKFIELTMGIELTGNFKATILKFFEKFDYAFSHVFIFGNMFLESHCFVAMPVTRCVKGTCSNLSLSNY